MTWKFRNDQQLWIQLAEIMTHQIVSGKYPPGSRFPSVRELAAEAGVNPNTMQRAMTALEEQGLLICQRNTGRFVTEDTVLLDTVRRNIAQTEFAAFCERMHLLGFTQDEIKTLFKHTNKEETA